MKLKSILRRLLHQDPDMQPNLCYGQDGEDLILDRLLERQVLGFYVDVGAHHPMRFSNTYLFYRKGWHGINIDAQPGGMRLFQRYRPRDTNIESGVGLEPGYLPYFQFNEPALNTFDPNEAALKDRPPYHLVQTVQVQVERLDALLEKHLPSGQVIDFLSVDVEGRDLDVLRSNNWERFRPRYILAETLRADILHLMECPVVQFLASVGYKPVAKAYNTTFFVAGDAL
jgi:FkbM family methyltransferase